jgi:hypothetical protein
VVSAAAPPLDSDEALKIAIVAAVHAGDTVRARALLDVLDATPSVAPVLALMPEGGADTVVGWVPRWALSNPEKKTESVPWAPWVHGAGIGRGTWLGGTILCPHAVPLVVEQDAQRSQFVVSHWQTDPDGTKRTS